MAYDVETAETAESDSRISGDGSGLLAAIHQRWLERTEGGDIDLIMSSFNMQMKTGRPNEDFCIGLFEGHIVQVGSEHISKTKSEYEIYLTGRRAVRGYMLTDAAQFPGQSTLWEVLEALETAFERESQEDAKTGETSPEEASTPPVETRGPRVRRLRTNHDGYPGTGTRSGLQSREALDMANTQRNRLAEVRTALKEGQMSLAEALDNPHAARMTVADLLIRVPKVGKQKRKNALKALKLAAATEVGALTDEEKAYLVKRFPTDKYRKSPSKSAAPASPSVIESRTKSLKKANDTRRYRAQVKLKLAAGGMRVEELFDDQLAAGMRVGDILLKLPSRTNARTRLARVTSRKLMDVVLEETAISGSQTLDKLTDRQREQLLTYLAARYDEEKGIYKVSKVTLPKS